MKTGYYFLLKNKSTTGKNLAQLFHAVEKLYCKYGSTFKKIVYKITEEEENELGLFLKKNKIKYIEIIDAGLTQLKPGTKTVIATVLQEYPSFFQRYKLY